MHYLALVCLILLFLQELSHTLSSETSQPYCYRNISTITYKEVTKTRLKTVNKKGLFNKLIQKKETQVEIYEDQEPVYKIKVERGCCEGYKMTELDMCEPQCIENGCPPNSKCVEPEVCECVSGYYSARSPNDSKHYCEPICEKACPEHSVCIAPNVCACRKGFEVTHAQMCEPYCASGCPNGGKCIAPNKCQCPEGFNALQGSCLPTCFVGDQCRNGECIGSDVCLCNSGFEWNDETLKCETTSSLEDLGNFESTTYSPDAATLDEENAFHHMDMETDVDSDKDDIDPNEAFDEFLSTTTDNTRESEEDFSSPHTVSKHHKCPDDHVYYKGQCRPLKFVSNEIDCRLKLCEDKHSHCLENDTCTCNEGYQWFKVHVVDPNSGNYTIKGTCLTKTEYEARLQEESKHDQADSATNWVWILFIVLGVLVLFSALVYLGLKLLRIQTGQMDVQGKNFTCSYNKRRNCTESENSVI